MDDLEFVAWIEGRIKAVDALVLLSPGEEREKRLCGMVRARDEALADAAKENSRLWNWGAECQAKLETYKVRLAKHEEAAKELRAARADVLADHYRGDSRFWDALEAIERLLQEDAVE